MGPVIHSKCFLILLMVTIVLECIKGDKIIECKDIWSNFMRRHIGLKICHFLQSVLSITEGPKKTKLLRKSGIHSSIPCYRTIFFCWVCKKTWCFLGPPFNGRSVVLIDVLCYSCGFKRYHFLHFFRTPFKTKIVLKYCPYMGQNYGCQISL